ncbi:uncharacterized protein LOC117301803 [Asterias rubens]|uniref:uncharacterized protein LOC117301803 n=1 Tax=Asterias rubens TaxID=7604 RepID=UPI0014557410|nr:uncharacterized protein LOC117301803 [Asterias rubens]
MSDGSQRIHLPTGRIPPLPSLEEAKRPTSQHLGVVSEELNVSSEPWVDISEDTAVTCSSSAGLVQVNWRKGPDTNHTFAIVIYNLFPTPSVVWNPSVDQTHYAFDEMLNSFPLTIKSTTLDDEDRYWCQAVQDVTFAHQTNSTAIAIRDRVCSDRMDGVMETKKWTPYSKRTEPYYRFPPADFEKHFATPVLPDSASDKLVADRGSTSSKLPFADKIRGKLEDVARKMDLSARLGLRTTSFLLLHSEYLEQGCDEETMVPADMMIAALHCLENGLCSVLDQFTKITTLATTSRRANVLDALFLPSAGARKRLDDLPLTGVDLFSGQFQTSMEAESADTRTVRLSQAPLPRGGNKRPPPQGGGAYRPPFWDSDRFHVNLLLDSQEGGWRVAPDFELETPQQVHPSEAFPHGDAQDHTEFYSDARMGGESRPEGRIPTRPSQAGAPQIPTFPIQQYPVRICGAPIRTLHLTSGVHPDCKDNRGGTAEAGHHDICISGRLVGHGPFSRGDGGSAPIYLAPDLLPRIYNQYREIQPYPLAGSQLSRCAPRPAQGIGPPFGGTPTEPSAVRFSLAPGSGGPGAGLARAVGPYGQHGGFGGLLQVEDEAHSTSPALLLQPHPAPNPPPGADHALASPPPSLVASRCEHLAEITVPPNTVTIAYDSVTYSGGSVSVIAGTSRQFTCDVPDIKPAAVFSWATAPLQPTDITQNDTPSTPDNRLVDSSSTITVNIPETPAQQQLRCVATNRQDGRTESEVEVTVTLQVKVPPKESAMSLTSTGTNGDRVSVTQGSEHAFACLVQGTRPAATIKWYLNDILQATINPAQGGVGDNLIDTSSDWSFTPLRSNHLETVKCEASTAETTLPAPSVMITLEVNGPPDNPVISSTSPTMTENVATTLTCRADLGYPESWSLVWFKGSDTLTGTVASAAEFNNRYSFTSTSEITPVREDNGQTSIKCMAQWDSWNSANPEGSLVLNVQFCARTVSVTNCPTVTVGSTALLTCVSESSNPATTLTWSRDGTNQTNTSPQPDSDGSNGGIITTLDITTNVLTKADNGAVFQCSASNDAVMCGVDIDVTDSCALNVQYTPEFTEASANPVTPVIEGGEVILTCTADANPKPSNFILWEKQDSPSTVLSSVYNDGTSTLTLSDIQRDQAGSYRCKANNGIPTSNPDVVSESVIVIVHYEVNITNKEDNEMGAKNEQDANLSCKAVGNPVPVMMWFDPNNTVITSTRNPDKYTVEDTTSGGNDIYGFMMTSSLTIKRVNSEVDYGLYTCSSSNGIGQVDMLRVLLDTRRPNVPSGVILTGRTSSSIAVRWSAGYDGGETQWFHISHKKAADSSETYSDMIDGEVTTYNVDGLESYTEYEIKVYAQNAVDRNPIPGIIVEYTLPRNPSDAALTIEFNKGADTVKVSGFKGEGCIQLEVKYVIKGGSTDWIDCGECVTADSEVVLADWCPQTQKRRRRAVGDVGEVRAKYCRTSGSVTLCSDPITPEEVVPAPPHATNPGVIAGVIVGVTLLVVVVILVYILRSRLRCHIEVIRKSPPQVSRSDRKRITADKQPVYQDIKEMTPIHSNTTGEDNKTYANLPSAEKAFPRNKLRIIKEIGHGAFGKVLLAQAEGILERSTITLVAVKTLKDGANTNEKDSSICELELMKKLPEHCNVVKLIGYCIQQDPPYIIVEYLSRGNLKDLLKDSRSKGGRVYGNLHGVSKSLTSRDLMKFANDVADGMRFISYQKCIHRDLAARNILVAEDMTCKVSDFGLARDVMNIRVYERGSDGRLPLRWMALESILDDVYTTKSDVWSFGTLLWEIVTLGARPYPAMSAKTMIKELQNGYRMPKPNHCQDELYQVMLKCWKEDPDVRPPFRIISHTLNKLAATRKDCISIKVYEETVYEVTISEDQSEKV